MAVQQDPTQQYRALRVQLRDELTAIEVELETLTKRREELKQLLYGEVIVEITHAPAPTRRTRKPAQKTVTQKGTKRTAKVDPNIDRLVGYLKNNPGASRQNLKELFGNKLSDNELTNLIHRLSRRGIIKAEGVKRHATWQLA